MSFDPKQLARQEIVEMQAYQPFRGSTGTQLRLQANENRMKDTAISRYPGPSIDALAAALAAIYGVADDSILVTRGSDDAIDALCRTFLTPYKDAILTFTPTFLMYERASAIQGATAYTIDMGDDLVMDFDAAREILDREDNIKLVFICAPQNPGGPGVATNIITSLVEDYPNTLIVVDEAYIEFSTEKSMTASIANYPNLVVLRTLSKAWGLAGARVGCMLANPEVVNLTERVFPSYYLPVSSAEEAFKILTPAGIARMKADTATLINERDKLAKELEALDGVIRVFESHTNFLLVQFKDVEAAEKKLIDAQILARNFSHQIKDCIRITVGNAEENVLIINALGGSSDAPTDRTAAVERTTKETSILATVNLDKSEPSEIKTGIGFFDHMLEQVAKHSGIAITINATGDTFIDTHHTVEDTMLTLGEAFKKALGDKRGIGRYGFALPMDEVRAEVLLDMSGRAVSRVEGKFESPMLGDLPTEMIPHAFISFASSLDAALHVTFDGDNDHHKAEGAFKALAKALKQACAVEGTSLPSTKGTL